MTTLVVGGLGFVGAACARRIGATGEKVVATSRAAGAEEVVRDLASLQAAVDRYRPDQVLVTAQLAGDVGWIIEAVDGPRWLLLSSAQLGASVAPPDLAAAIDAEARALDRGATVLRPTMIFGDGRDRNLSRLVRAIAARRPVPVPGTGAQLVQPLHVADLADLVHRHRVAPHAGRFDVGGDEQLPLAELIDFVGRAVGSTPRVVHVPVGLVRVGARAAGAFGLRADQVRRLLEDKVVDISRTATWFGWAPAPLWHGVEAAVDAALA